MTYHTCRACRPMACLAVAIITVLATARPASAHKRDFAFTYEWWTAAKGEKEIEVWNTYATEAKAYQGQIEFETGITDRWTAALYYLHEKEEGESGVDGYKVETRYRFGEFEEEKILPAAYLEYEKVEGEAGEVEAKAIFSRFVGDTNLSLNLIAERHTESGAETETGYALGYARGTRNPALRMGLEATGSFQENAHALGPVFAYDFNTSTRAVLSTNFAITDKADSRIRLLVEYEFF